jgi:hypothetical protein
MISTSAPFARLAHAVPPIPSVHGRATIQPTAPLSLSPLRVRVQRRRPRRIGTGRSHPSHLTMRRLPYNVLCTERTVAEEGLRHRC